MTLYFQVFGRAFIYFASAIVMVTVLPAIVSAIFNALSAPHIDFVSHRLIGYFPNLLIPILLRDSILYSNIQSIWTSGWQMDDKKTK